MASISQPIYPLVAGLGAVQGRREWAYGWFSSLERMPCNCNNLALGSLLRVTRFLSPRLCCLSVLQTKAATQ